MTPREVLLRMLAEHPEARVVTDVGASLISGWGDLKECVWIPEHNVIELMFD